MEPKDCKCNTGKGSSMIDDDKVVTLGPKGNSIAEEPEMVRLKGLLDTGQVDQERLEQYIEEDNMKKKSKKDTKTNIGIKVDRDLWEKTRIQAIKEGRTSGRIVEDALRAYLERVAKPGP